MNADKRNDLKTKRPSRDSAAANLPKANLPQIVYGWTRCRCGHIAHDHNRWLAASPPPTLTEAASMTWEQRKAREQWGCDLCGCSSCTSVPTRTSNFYQDDVADELEELEGEGK